MMDKFLAGRTLLLSANQDNLVLSYDGRWHKTHADIPTGISINGRDGLTAIGVQGGIAMYRTDGILGSTLHSGRLITHEVVFEGDQLLVAAAGRSSVISVGSYGEVTTRWQIPGVDESDDSRTHVNGLALRDGKLRYVSALAVSNVPDGWRAEMAKSKGVVFDVADNSIVGQDLLMPHSPRWYDGKLWLTESGRGNIWCGGQIFAHTDGFCRGLILTDDYVFVGISQGRLTAIPELEIDRLAQPGIMVFDTSGTQVHFEPLDIQEIMDIQLGAVALQ